MHSNVQKHQELVCFYNNTSILLYVLRWQVGGHSPPSPPKSATGKSMYGTITLHAGKIRCREQHDKHEFFMTLQNGLLQAVNNST